MKKIITILMLILMAVPGVLSQEVQPEVEAGISPDSGLYFLDVMFDELKVKLASGTVEKARIRLEIAEERTAEIEVMAKQNKLQDMEKAIAQERKEIKEIEKLQEKMTEQEKVNTQQKFQKHIMNMEQVKERVNEQAKKGIENAIQNANQAFERKQLSISEQNRQSVEEIKEDITAGNVQIKESQNIK